MKKVPLGIQSFERIIKDDYLYIDKTEQIRQLVTEGSFYLLSRPRRFGKSLVISTLSALFEGKKELFKNTVIYGSDWDWTPRPVIHFDFSEFSREQSEEELKDLIKDTLRKTADKFSLTVEDDLPYNRYFASVLKQLPEQAVILIDEYDRPVLNKLHNTAEAEKMMQILEGFYIIIKSHDAHVRFSFLTGVSRFVISGFNNLTDLTMREKQADLCGITEHELDIYFSEELKAVGKELNMPRKKLKEEIKHWYEGYRFSSADAKVYNPVSIMSFIRDHRFSDYWFEAESPALLIDFMKKKNFILTDLESMPCPVSSFSFFDVVQIKPLPYMVQTGYLTITGYDAGLDLYTLSPPNRDVKKTFYEALLCEYAGLSSNAPMYQLIKAVGAGRIDDLFTSLDQIFETIPEDVSLSCEKHWQSIFHLIFSLLGYFIETEYKTNTGRIDAVIQTAEHVYILEFKFTETDDAEKQKQEQEYARMYKDSKKRVNIIPAVFSYEDRKCTILRG